MRSVLMSVAVLAIIQGSWITTAQLGTAIPGQRDDRTLVSKDVATALSASPLNSRLWLALSSSSSKTDSSINPASAIEMAFLTGGEKIEDISERLIYVVQSTAFQNKTVQDLVRTDINLMMHSFLQFGPLVLSLQKKALPANAETLSKMIKDAETTKSGSSHD